MLKERRVHVRQVLMSSGMVATAIDSPDSHDDKFQRRAMQERRVDAVLVADQESEYHDSEACEVM